MKEIIIDCSLVACPGDLHRALAQALAFPEHYGANLDALHDCLTDISRETRVCLLHWDTAEALLGRNARRAILDAVTENPRLSVLFD